MSPRLRPLLLIGSHLAVLGLVYAITRGSIQATLNPDGEPSPSSPHATAKSSDRNNSTPSSDGEALLADFIQHRGENPSTSPYRLLKATLPVAADPEAAAREAIDA